MPVSLSNLLMHLSWLARMVAPFLSLKQKEGFTWSSHPLQSPDVLYLQGVVMGSGDLLTTAATSEASLDGLSVRRQRMGSGRHPAVSDPETVLSFAKMCSNSYSRRNVDFDNPTGDYTGLDGFGWNKNGLRGHVYANAARSLVVIAFKGTSTLLMGGGTVSMDKYTDNVMFSCCCARVDISWIPVCGCYLGGPSGVETNSQNSSSGRCNQTCLVEMARNDSMSYYSQAVRIVRAIQASYPNSQLWFTGHSLGGSIASLMAVTFGSTAAVTFSAPGDRLYADRLGIGSSRGPFWSFPIWNFGVSTDPVYMGTCQGMYTSCYISGYAMETRCRHGRDCLIQIEAKKGLYDVNTHRIDWMIDNALQGQYRLPACRPDVTCQDCVRWAFEDI